MIRLNEEQEQEMQELGSLFLPLDKIALFFEINFNEFLSAYHDKNSRIFKLIEKGRLQTEIKINRATFTLAMNGSAPALLDSKKIIDETLRIERNQSKLISHQNYDFHV